MTTSPLNQTALARAVAARLGVGRDAGEAAVRAVLDEIAAAVTAGRDVILTNFGTFRAVAGQRRMVRNINTGDVFEVPARPGIRFRSAPRLRDVIAAGDPNASIRKHPSK